MSKLDQGDSSGRLGERVEFRFSSFCAVQVPVVSDRLRITIISMDNGRIIAKSSKAAALNGICQWPDSILDPIWFSQDEVSEEFHECQYKIIVSMGSTKTGILGEIFLNLTNYISSSESTAISLPLKRCNSGTVLQLKIQCLGAKSKSSGKPWNELSPRLDDYSRTDDDMERKSDGSDSMLNKSTRSLSGNHLEGAYQDEAANRDASFLPPETHPSSNSGEGSTDSRNLSPMNNSNEGLYTGRQDSASSASHDNEGRDNDSSKGLLDTAKQTIVESRNEAKMWERRSRKLKIELETLKNECAEKSKQQAELALELSASHSEQQSLRHEIEELKSSLEEVTACQTILGSPKSGDGIHLQKDITDEVQFLKESNANLTAQLNKTQEANIELVAILQELEETIEIQRVEMSNLSHESDAVDHEVSKRDLPIQEDAEWARILSLKEVEMAMLREKLDRILSIENVDGAGPDAIYLELEKENDFLKVKIQELENDCSELTEENLELIYKLKEVSGVAKGEDPCISNSEQFPNVGRSTSKVKYLESKCAELELNLLNFSSEFSELEEKFQKSQEELNERTLELSELREKLFHATELEGAETCSAGRYQLRSGGPDDTKSDLDVMNCRVLLKEQEIEGLQHSTKEMEKIISDIGKEKSQLEERLATALQESSMTSECLDVMNRRVLEQEIEGVQHSTKEMEEIISDIGKEKSQLEERLATALQESSMTSECLDVMNRRVLLKEQEIEDLQHSTKEMEKIISDIGKEKSQLEERLATALQESSMTSECLDVMNRRVLEQEIEGLQHSTKEMEKIISDIGKEKSQLEERLATALQESSMTSECLDVMNRRVLEQEIEGLQHSTKEMEKIISDIGKEKSQLEERLATALQESSMTSECLDVMNRRVLLKEQEIEGLQHSTKEMEKIISDIGKEKSQLEERLATALQESSMTSECLDEVRKDLLELTSSVNSHVSANKVLETNITELEICKVELELHVSKLEHENVELSEFLSEVEAQFTSLVSENESTKLHMDHAISIITSLNDKVEQQQAEMEAQKMELKRTHLESERRLLEVQDDSEGLRKSNVELQATFDSVVEECDSLQTLIGDLKMQNLELHDRSTQLEQELEQSKRKTIDFCKTVEFLEAKLSLLQKDVTSKKQSLLAELENIFQEHKEHEERINRAHFLLNKIENEKIVEVKNLQREVMSLNAQVSSTHGERESAALDSIREVSILRADNAKLEAGLEDANAQMRHYEFQLDDLRNESKSKIEGLVDSLNASKQNEQALTRDVEHMRRLMEAAKSNEENLRKTSDELELKYKSSDYEKQQIMEEISGLKYQVNKMASLQDKVFKLQSSLDEAKFEKGKLEELMQSLSLECEELKAQKAMLTDRVSRMQGTLHDADEEHSKSIQAKLVIKLGNDATNDNGDTTVNDDNGDIPINDDNGDIPINDDNGDTPVNEVPDIQTKIQMLETRLAEALEENKLFKAAQLQSPTREEQTGSRDEKENNDGNRIAQLESELKDMQDRLLNVSLQYAEVEAQREELVMELKSATAKKGRWFS